MAMIVMNESLDTFHSALQLNLTMVVLAGLGFLSPLPA